MRVGTKRWLSSSVTVEPYSSIDEDGQQTYGTAVTYDAFVAHKSVKVFNPDGVEVVSSAQVYLDEDAVITSSARITLPDGTKPRILAVETSNNITDGTAYLKVVYT
jgi:CxxC motif-containing protein (DUF1111 family)